MNLILLLFVNNRLALLLSNCEKIKLFTPGGHPPNYVIQIMHIIILSKQLYV